MRRSPKTTWTTKLSRTILALFKWGLWAVWILIQVPFLILLATFSRRFGVWQFHIFMMITARLFGIRFKLHGALDKQRPLLLVSNHISIFELIAFPALFNCGFFAKGEIKRWPVAAWFVYSFGNLFIDRRPAKAKEAILTIKRHMRTAKNPYAIFPEGTTNNGNYVLPFKSALFDFVADSSAKIQPMVIFYRDKYGRKIPAQILADQYAYFNNAKQTQPPYAKQELTIMQLLHGTMMRGGFMFEIYALPAFDPKGLDRKQAAAAIHEIVSAKFEELK